MTRYHCLKCEEDDVHVHAGDGYHFGCSGRAIPIATICDPPEPTVIEASDLAPGMVVVTVDDGFTLGETTWIQRWDVEMTDRGIAISSHGVELAKATPSAIRRIAGKGRPC